MYNVDIDAGNYTDSTVLREKGRIDIWVFDKTSKHSFFIENKINDAPDRLNQIEDYNNYVQERNFCVDCIVYLSKDGSKTAPIEDFTLTNKILNIAAFDNSSKDLVSGWLHHSLEISSNEDSRSFIYQYIKLLSHLSNKKMDTQVKANFYKFINDNEALNNISLINDLYLGLPEFRSLPI